MAWPFSCFSLLIDIQGVINSYSQQIESLKVESGTGVTIYSDYMRRNTR
ncbi:hypothetical protein [Erwinia sp. V71]